MHTILHEINMKISIDLKGYFFFVMKPMSFFIDSKEGDVRGLKKELLIE